MADFISNFWNLYVIVLTIGSVLACAVFLYFLSRKKVKPGAVQTTGHTWDEDLAEYDNPLPRWWMYLFYITVFFALVYLALFPGLGNVQGVLGWSSTGQYDREVAKAEQTYGPIYQKFAALSVEDAAEDPAALAIGQRLFVNNCAQCHGTDAKGAKGFPNLADKDWSWGGDGLTIKTSILQGRMGMMPPMAAAVGSEAEVEAVANYVLSLSGSPHDAAKVALGQEKFLAACAACHGAEGTGNTAMGAPNLTDKVWIYGGSINTIKETIHHGRQGVMPAWQNILGEEKSHLVAVYVYSLSQKP
ncbi:MAG: cytochrome-c oxidase, cbb3-type subunit III [Burkholderiaceae bacterium]|jgi:cytochrome c oxidase cbb3-type subunit 3